MKKMNGGLDLGASFFTSQQAAAPRDVTHYPLHGYARRQGGQPSRGGSLAPPTRLERDWLSLLDSPRWLHRTGSAGGTDGCTLQGLQRLQHWHLLRRRIRRGRASGRYPYERPMPCAPSTAADASPALSSCGDPWPPGPESPKGVSLL